MRSLRCSLAPSIWTAWSPNLSPRLPALNLAQALFMGLLQGATELFPVSSLGHSVIIPSLLHWRFKQSDPTFVPFLVLLHLGTAGALLVLYRSEWVEIIRRFFAAALRGSITAAACWPGSGTRRLRDSRSCSRRRRSSAPASSRSPSSSRPASRSVSTLRPRCCRVSRRMQARDFFSGTSAPAVSIRTAGTASAPGSPAWLCYISACDEIELARDRSGGSGDCFSDLRRSLRDRRAATLRIHDLGPAFQARDPLRGAGRGQLCRRELRAAEDRLDLPRRSRGDSIRHLAAADVFVADPDVFVIDGVGVDLPGIEAAA